jgi:hypothetical protein
MFSTIEHQKSDICFYSSLELTMGRVILQSRRKEERFFLKTEKLPKRNEKSCELAAF